jgi:acyl-CoA thioesterase
MAGAALLSASAAFPAADGSFPRLREGSGKQLTFGGGVVAGKPYVALTAVVIWSRRSNSLTLYLLRQRAVTCATLGKQTAKPGQLVEIHVTSKPHVPLGHRVSTAQVAFITVSRNPKVAPHVAGLRTGARLLFTRVDTYPGGVWHGIFKVPQRIYGDGNQYGYNGTFAARWCQA